MYQSIGLLFSFSIAKKVVSQYGYIITQSGFEVNSYFTYNHLIILEKQKGEKKWQDL